MPRSKRQRRELRTKWEEPTDWWTPLAFLVFVGAFVLFYIANLPPEVVAWYVR